MAGISTKDLKARIRSMESTRQITKAMEMVAASKLRGAQDKANLSRPYFETLYSVMQDLAAGRGDEPSPFVRTPKSGKALMVVIAGDRGLAGGYNSGVLKAAWEAMAGKDCTVLPLGRKAVEFFRSRKTRILTDQYGEAASLSAGDCFSLAKLMVQGYLQEEHDEVILCYTQFQSVLRQEPAVKKLLPLGLEESAKPRDILYEPDSETVMAAIVPEYLGGVLYGALCSSIASEQAARRTAMDAATKNADEMIEDLSLQYNRARQGAITQEITEIVAGAEN